MSTKSSKKINTRSLTTCAMLSAIAFILQFVEFSIPIIPSFVKLDFSDLPALIGAFVLGPVWGVAIQLIKNIVHIPFGSSAAVGELCNFLLGAVFAFTAGMIYKFKHTKSGAVIAGISGAVAMAAVSLPLNYFFVYPAYEVILKFPMNAIIGAYEAILGSVASIPTGNPLFNCLLIFNVPFTFAKGIVCVVICHLIYKPISRLYHKQ